MFKKESLKFRSKAIWIALGTLLLITLFFLPSRDKGKTTQNTPRILIMDMVVSDLSAFKKIKSPAQIYSVHFPDSETDSPKLDPSPEWTSCQEEVSQANHFFRAQLDGSILELDDLDLEVVQNTVTRSHGYHVLGLVQAGLSKSEIGVLGVPPHPTEGIIDPTQFLADWETYIFSRFERALKEFKPSLVVAATSESEEEIFKDLLRAGHGQENAFVYSRKIFSTWKSFWKRILSAYPQTIFVVPAGNGGIDGVGDLLANESVIPASLSYPNLIVVASTDSKGCLSSFSNFNEEHVYVGTYGELVESWTPCQDSSFLQLSGTSQSTALVGNFIAHAMERGMDIHEAFEGHLLERKDCAHGKFRYFLDHNGNGI